MKKRIFSTSVLLSIVLFIICSNLNAQYQAYDFSIIDAKARKSPKKLNSDLPNLSKYLLEHTNNELEKVRAIYSWITSHINYDWKALEQDKRINHFTRDILDRKVALCSGYAQLFQEMCELLDLNSHRINGYAKGAATNLALMETPNHSWNAVQINGEWYLLDATWGSSGINQEEEVEITRMNDHFLVSPEKFIRTHLPGNPIWQLLSTPVPVDIFMHSNAAIYQHLSNADSTFSFRDSIQYFIGLSPAKKRLLDYEQTYQFHPNEANANELGHALVDYAGILSDTIDLLSREKDQEQIFRLNAQIIQYCRRAYALTPFYPWQQELFINALVNQAVAQYNRAHLLEQAVEKTHEEILSLLREAQRLLDLSEESYFTRMVRQQCEQYLETIEVNMR